MASAIHQTEMSTFASAKAAIICDVCRKHVDLPMQCAEACGDESPDESMEQHPSTIKVHKDADHFDCNICLDGCHDPVITQCGHLFCWPCLYYWLSLHSVSKECPVCKASVQDKIIPLYGPGKAEQSMNSGAIMFPDMHIPCRPLPSSRSDVPVAVTDLAGERNHSIQEHTISARHAAPSANVGFFASMLRCGMPSYLHGGASILAPRQRFSNEKEFVLHWACIFVACIAIVYFIVC